MAPERTALTFYSFVVLDIVIQTERQTYRERNHFFLHVPVIFKHEYAKKLNIFE